MVNRLRVWDLKGGINDVNVQFTQNGASSSCNDWLQNIIFATDSLQEGKMQWKDNEWAFCEGWPTPFWN